jgi:hypothetical protein
VAYSANHTRQHRNKKRNNIIVLLVVSLLVLGGLFFFAQRDRSQTEEAGTVTSTPVAINEAVSSIEGRYLFTGTIVLARGVEQQALINGAYDYRQPFSQLSSLEPDKYDAWVTDLECPVTERVMTFREQVETLVFNCRPEFLDPIKDYFDIINLANNHSGDLGQAAFVETQERLDEAGFQVFGNYDPSVAEDICTIVPLPVRQQLPNDEEQVAELPVAFCGWHYFTQEPNEQQLDVMMEYADIMPVFAFTHSGGEYLAEAQPGQVSLARGIIDRGAEFVINNNPHWVQNTEVYNDRLIVYSTGNFIFDQLDEETNRAANIDTTIRLEYDENVERWLQLADECRPRRDTCLELARQQNLEKVSLSYEYDVVASLNGYREITRRADPATQNAIEQRMNWPETLRQLGQADR